MRAKMAYCDFSARSADRNAKTPRSSNVTTATILGSSAGNTPVTDSANPAR